MYNILGFVVNFELGGHEVILLGCIAFVIAV